MPSARTLVEKRRISQNVNEFNQLNHFSGKYLTTLVCPTCEVYLADNGRFSTSCERCGYEMPQTDVVGILRLKRYVPQAIKNLRL